MVKVNIESVFDKCIKRLGGVRTDSLFSKPPNFDNADYLLDDRSIVAELKNLDRNHEEDPTFQEKLDNLYQDWVLSEKSLPAYGAGRIDTSKISHEQGFELFGILKDILEGSVKKANKQIKETKRNVEGCSNAAGLLLLSNEQNRILDPYLTFYLLNRILTNQHRSIDAVIYFSANLHVHAPTLDSPKNLWLWLDAPCEGRNIFQKPQDLEHRLRNSWASVLKEEVGIHAPEFALFRSPEELHDAYFRS